jgi:DNA-binding NarL/FixJ family response regulator
VLIVDDIPAVREALRWAFEDTPDLIVVGEADDGVKALACAAELAPDVVILDVELPSLDGYAVAQALKQLEPAPLVIFLTVHGDGLSRQRAEAAGGDGFVEKGAGWPVLLQQIRRLLSQ